MEIAGHIRRRAAELGNRTAQDLSGLIQIRSLSGEEAAAIEHLRMLCTAAGVEDVRVDGLGNLVARVGRGPRILAIDAHIDTVDTGDETQWDLPPFSGRIAGGKVHGRGTVDQKGGAAAMVTAARLLRELGYDGDWSIYMTFTVMEEDCDGLCWNYLIEREGLVPEYAVITEPTNLGVYLGQRGRMEFDLAFSGVSAHGSAPERGDNAVYRASEMALRVRALHDRLASDAFLGKGSVAVTQIQSTSPSLCAIPDRCTMHLDRRLTWGETQESARAELDAISDGQTTIEVPVYDRESYLGTRFPQTKYYPTWKVAPDHPLVRAGVETYSALYGAPPRVDKWTFSTNGVAICGKHGIPCIGFGPGNEVYAHAPNEATPIDHLVKASAFYALLPFILEGEGR
ncbi:MAG: YgeY family selenium metabolism-linked hydrolase [Anaerolineae bacterium]|nr:YgeY family selenium metabolism-linked hydrolase [Anaerolineae bacterium]